MPNHGSSRRGSGLLAVKIVIGLLAILLIVSFVAKNHQQVDVSWYFDYHITVNLWVAILASFGAGIFIAGLGMSVALVMEKTRIRRLARKVADLETRVSEMKQQPLPQEKASPSKETKESTSVSVGEKDTLA